MHCTYPAEIGSGCDTAIDLLWISNYEISAQVWNMNAHDPDGYRAMAAAHLVSSCAKYDLLEITKTSIFKLRSDELDVYVHSLLQEDSGVQGLSALMSALHLTEDLIIGPVSFPEFMQLLNGDCDAAHTPRRTYIVIVRAEPLAPVQAEGPGLGGTTGGRTPQAGEAEELATSPPNAVDAFMREVAAEDGVAEQAIHIYIYMHFQMHQFFFLKCMCIYVYVYIYIYI